MNARTKRLALGEGMTAGILFGTASIFIRFMENLDAFSIAFWRLIIASLVLLVILLILKRPLETSLIKRNSKQLSVLSVFLGLHFIFFVSAVKDTTILNATVLVNTTPIFAMLISSFVYKVKPSTLAILGVTVAFVGVCVIAYAETFTSDASYVGVSPSLKGDLEAVLAALVESFYLNYGIKVRKQIPILSTMLPIYVLTSAVVGILSIPARNVIVLPMANLQVLIPLVGLGILPTAMAHTFYFSSLSNLKSFETAAMALLEPIGATMLGIAVFQEMPAPFFVGGAIFIFLGLLFIGKGSRQEISKGT